MLCVLVEEWLPVQVDIAACQAVPPCSHLHFALDSRFQTRYQIEQKLTTTSLPRVAPSCSLQRGAFQSLFSHRRKRDEHIFAPSIFTVFGFTVEGARLANCRSLTPGNMLGKVSGCGSNCASKAWTTCRPKPGNLISFGVS